METHCAYSDKYHTSLYFAKVTTWADTVCDGHQ